MDRYDARDLVRVPGLLSLSRIPLAAAFPFAVDRPSLALGILIGAGLSDVLDGWYARRFGEATATGAALDPVTDKLFVLTVAVTLVVTGQLTPLSVLMLSTREIGELPLVLWVALSPRARRARAEQPSANIVGKAATVLQFASVSVALFHASYETLWVDATAVTGAAAAFTYWRRALASTSE
jgi:cardiolipin synthase (CMP-forming)